MPGARRVKGYPITRDELFTLGGVGVLASAFFGFGANFISRSFDLAANLDLSAGISAEIIERWHTREYDFWYFGLVLLGLGILIAVFGGAKIWSIIYSTEHPDD
jgi:hypothetical protein